MSLPTSSALSTCSSESMTNSSETSCQVCSLPARGNHFGAITCRACAAFFRRADSAKTNVRECQKGNQCNLRNKSGWFDCKSCRLKKCYDVGMTSANFQFGRDPISTKISTSIMPQSFESFLGRPHCVIFANPQCVKVKKNTIDCNELIIKASKILENGSEYPLFARNNLLKLAMAMRKIDENHADVMKVVTKYGKEEILSFFENDFLKATKWFMYFDEFRVLSNEQKIKLMQAMWHVWSRLYKLSTAATGKRRKVGNNEQEIMISHDSEYTVMDLTKIEFDYSWCTNYSNEQMQHFIDNTENSFLYKLVDQMVELKPDDVELSFMICQACFHYASERFDGEFSEITDVFQDKLADELHDYYVNEKKRVSYSGRLAQLLKINNRIREDIWKCRSKQEIAEIFDVYSVVYSHPEIFKDI